jgi:hypothetical protein
MLGRSFRQFASNVTINLRGKAASVCRLKFVAFVIGNIVCDPPTAAHTRHAAINSMLPGEKETEPSGASLRVSARRRLTITNCLTLARCARGGGGSRRAHTRARAIVGKPEKIFFRRLVICMHVFSSTQRAGVRVYCLPIRTRLSTNCRAI